MIRDFDPKDVLRSADGLTSPISVAADDPDHYQIVLTMSPETLSMLMTNLASSSGQELEGVISKAFLLYEAAADARREGKVVGVAPTVDVLETEFVGL